MQTIIGLGCLALLMMWVDPASASELVSHPLTVSHHRKIAGLTVDKVRIILDEASKVVGRCGVRFKLRQPLREFAFDDTPEHVREKEDRDAVHKEGSVVKVVSTIRFCRSEELGLFGCAWDPPPDDEKRPRRRSMIVVNPDGLPGDSDERLKRAGVIWAHEFGHVTGLFHRAQSTALMTACAPDIETRKINRHECKCFRGGKGFCADDQEPSTPVSCGL
jgi:hypothetical protein